MKTSELIKQANTMLEKAYVPYSGFPVGSAVLTKSGNVYLGCNIENASYPLGNCAERTAIFNAVSHGEREFERLVVTSESDHATSPCGACRQVMVEFCDDDTPVTLTNRAQNETIETTVGELLPGSFRRKDLISDERDI